MEQRANEIEEMQVLRPARVCKLLDISSKTLTRMLADGRLTGVRLGREHRIHKSSVERLLEGHHAVGD
jgi:excisionase family DNA binding protein